MTNLQQYLQDREEEFDKEFCCQYDPEFKGFFNDLGSLIHSDGVIKFNTETLQTALKIQAEEIEKDLLEFQRNGESHSFEELYDEALSIIEKYT